jgi:phage replication-related protein YjqB (UPF0714/DUF867 family)
MRKTADSRSLQVGGNGVIVRDRIRPTTRCGRIDSIAAHAMGCYGQKMADDKYSSFDDLAAAEKRGEDYDFESRRRDASRVVVIAPHGGTIEPCTDKIADAIAENDFSFYCFKALKKNSGLHIKSHLFNEPTCEKLVAGHQQVISIHGWKEGGERVCVGGRDSELISALKKELVAKGIEVEDAKGSLKGTDIKNIVNRGATGRGVQFELTMNFRQNAALVEKFIGAIRAVLLDTRVRAQSGAPG